MRNDSHRRGRQDDERYDRRYDDRDSRYGDRQGLRGDDDRYGDRGGRSFDGRGDDDRWNDRSNDRWNDQQDGYRDRWGYDQDDRGMRVDERRYDASHGRQHPGDDRYPSNPSYGRYGYDQDRWDDGRRMGGDRDFGRRDFDGRENGRWDDDRSSRSRGGSESWSGVGSGPSWRGDQQFQGTSAGRAPSMRGKGPKNYQPDDRGLRERVCECLEDDHDLDPSDIDVACSKGEVTLTGTVDSRADKRRAERLVENVRGVKDVHNQITVKDRQQQTSTQNGTDAHRLGKGQSAQA